MTNFAPFTRMCQHKIEGKWGKTDLNYRVVAFCIYLKTDAQIVYQVALSEEGDLYFSHSGGAFSEKIPNAGAASPDAKGWGYMSGLHQIGIHLYACGNSGQVYKRIKENDWVRMDEGLLQDPKTPNDNEDRH